MISPVYMSGLIEGRWGYMVFNMNENQRQEMDTRRRAPAGPRRRPERREKTNATHTAACMRRCASSGAAKRV
ncbi:hypothetical protein C6Q28_18440 [Burkholderia multivorans]|nr:hypothetical protein C6Q11_28930 [Burkholderia multivorans]PRF58362.1 hypothetical protein C6Q28_18440 [Burkholderia multivorans]PRG84560.1 hypothetical protein C6T58_03665 [Burkholderia multivorans]